MKMSNLSTIMSSSSIFDWQYFPEVIFSDMMVMLGLKSIEELHKSKQVCQGWNMMISQMTQKKKHSIEIKAENLVDEIRTKWDTRNTLQGILDSILLLPDIVTAACLAYHGMLGSVERMFLVNVDLSSVPTKHLAALTSSLRPESSVVIENVSNTDLSPILDSVRCSWLEMGNQNLSTEETRALVRAMESGVEWICLGWQGDVMMDMAALTRYSGLGSCEKILILRETDRYSEEARRWISIENGDKYSEETRRWAQMMNWTCDINHGMTPFLTSSTLHEVPGSTSFLIQRMQHSTKDLNFSPSVATGTSIS